MLPEILLPVVVDATDTREYFRGYAHCSWFISANGDYCHPAIRQHLAMTTSGVYNVILEYLVTMHEPRSTRQMVDIERHISSH